METIGAHFSAVLEKSKKYFPGSYSYESARACLYALLKAGGARRIHIPNYMCEAIFNSVSEAGIEIVSYSIDHNFEFVNDLDIRTQDLILLVDYFGVNESAVLRQLKVLPKYSVIVDCSQAYFQRPFDCLATIYSPRKFIPVPDGGFIATNHVLQYEDADENASLERYKYLLQRIDSEPELSRDLYLKAEKDLMKISKKSMSKFSRNIVGMVDHQFIIKSRRENFKTLDALSQINKLEFDICDQVPLCYPLMVDDGELLREKLKEKRIFTPKYWPNVIPANNFEKELLDNTVYIPIDHRYKADDMIYIVDQIFNNK